MLSKFLEGIALAATIDAARAAYPWVGLNKPLEADGAAVSAMRKNLNNSGIYGNVVIGEGERDNAPLLFSGERIGNLAHLNNAAPNRYFFNKEVDIAVDPIEGTNFCAKGAGDAFSIIAISHKDSILNAPDVYMEKIAVGPHIPQSAISLDNTVSENLKNIASISGKTLNELNVVILDRPRHQNIITETLNNGANLKLISDGDIMGAASVTLSNKSDLFKKTIDLYIGTGGAPEGVIAAAILKCIGGHMECRLKANSQNIKTHNQNSDIYNKKYHIDDMIRSDDIVIAATGITTGEFFCGINNKIAHSLVITKNKIQTIKTLLLL